MFLWEGSWDVKYANIWGGLLCFGVAYGCCVTLALACCDTTASSPECDDVRLVGSALEAGMGWPFWLKGTIIDDVRDKTHGSRAHRVPRKESSDPMTCLLSVP